LIAGFQWPEPEDAHDEKLISDVREYGLHIINVFADDSGPGWSFTVGLFLNYSHPEVLIYGLKERQSHLILNDLRDHVATGETFLSGARTDALLQGHDVCFLDVPLEQYPDHLGYAMWFYRSLPEPFPCVQLVWPDKANKFPWEQGYDKSYSDLQPLLAAPQ